MLISGQSRATVKQAINKKQVFDKMLGLAVNTRSKSWETIALIIHASKLLRMEGEYSADVGRSRQQTCGELSPALDELHPQEEMLQPPQDMESQVSTWCQGCCVWEDELHGFWDPDCTLGHCSCNTLSIWIITWRALMRAGLGRVLHPAALPPPGPAVSVSFAV